MALDRAFVLRPGELWWRPNVLCPGADELGQVRHDYLFCPCLTVVSRIVVV